MSAARLPTNSIKSLLEPISNFRMCINTPSLIAISICMQMKNIFKMNIDKSARNLFFKPYLRITCRQNVLNAFQRKTNTSLSAKPSNLIKAGTQPALITAVIPSKFFVMFLIAAVARTIMQNEHTIVAQFCLTYK